MKKRYVIIILMAYLFLSAGLLLFQLYNRGFSIAFLSNLIFILCIPVLHLFYHRSGSGDREKLIERIYSDRRTGLPNREKLRIDVVEEDVVLFLINIDSFKEVNDFYGNPVGDVVILSLAERLKTLLARNPFGLLDNARLYKLETDEFGILVDSPVSDGQIRRIADQIAETVHDAPFHVQSSEVTIHISQGISSVEGDETHPGILAQADMALKRAKDKRVPFLIYNHSMAIHKEYAENIRWTHTVKQSIREDRVIPYYQPIINNKTGRIEKYECLMRIIDKEENIVYPEKFLKVSKRSRLYSSLSRIMISKVVKEMPLTDADYNVNISVDDVQDKDTFLHIRWTLEEHWKEAPRICFELLESESIENIPELPGFIRMIKHYGCSIALDDFGTGYSNFHYIMQLDPDYIKIDSSIIRSLDRDPNALTIAETLVGFAKKTGIRTVAEFVHSPEIFRIVRRLGIDYSQGYYLGEPAASSVLVTRDTQGIAMAD